MSDTITTQATITGFTARQGFQVTEPMATAALATAEWHREFCADENCTVDTAHDLPFE
jgi:hypothetical protein